MRYVLIYLTARKSAYTSFEWFEFYVLIFLLDLDTRQNMHNQDEGVLEHYKKGFSVSCQKTFLQ